VNQNIEHGNNYFKIRCKNCGEDVVEAQTLDKLMELFFQKIARNNLDSMDEKLCENASENISFDNMRGTFANGYMEVLVPTRFEAKAVEWETSEELIK